jgi:hypothetical protein
VRSPDHRPAHRRHYPARQPTPEQAAAAYAEAFKSRAQWRAECAAGIKVSEPQQVPARITPRPPADEATRRAQYAAQVARAEFGRFYWQDPLAGKKKPPKRPGNGAARTRS